MDLARISVDSARDDADAEFLAWIDPHWETMRRVAWRLARPGDGDDVLQNAALSAWRHRSSFDESRGSAVAWLTTITVNEARKSRRTWGRVNALPDVAVTDMPEASIDVHRAVRQLPKRQALAIELYYYVGLPISDTATVMNCAEGTVKSTLAAARAALQRLLGDDYR